MSPALAPPRTFLYRPEFAPVSEGHPLYREPVARVWGRDGENRVRAGMGNFTPAQLAQQIGGITGAAATGALSAASLAGLITVSAGVIPLIGVGIAAVTAAVSLILNSGCGQTCIVTSNWANNAEQLLLQNIQSYFSLPSPRSQTAKNVALANFDNVWSYLSQQCGSGAIGVTTAGIDCTKDRARGSCKWTQSSTSPLLQYPGEPQPGACWNWFNGYRDPIAMDPAVPDSIAIPAGGSGSTSATLGATDYSSWILYGGLGLLALAVIGGIN